MIFLDTNIILRYLTKDDPSKAEKCNKLFKKAVKKEVVLYSTTMVIAEVVWVLESFYGYPRKEVAETVMKILNTENIKLDEKDILLAAAGLYSLKKIDFIDAYNAIVMEEKKIDTVYSYDSDFDLLESLKRIEP